MAFAELELFIFMRVKETSTLQLRVLERLFSVLKVSKVIKIGMVSIVFSSVETLTNEACTLLKLLSDYQSK